jgi:NDP-sugar pyrophosphorylase family protein
MNRSQMNFVDVPVAVLAGGLATRLQPLTQTIPKALVDIAGRPFIDYQLDLFRRRGMRRIVFCLGHLGEQVAEHLGDGSAWNMEFQYCFDGDRLLGECFWTCYGDSYMDIDYHGIFDFFKSQPEGVQGLMTVLHNANRWDSSNAVFQNGRLLRYSKRGADPLMTYIDYGVAILTRQTVLQIPPGEAYDLARLYETLVEAGKMEGYEVHERFYEIGTPASLAEAREHLGKLSPLLFS